MERSETQLAESIGEIERAGKAKSVNARQKATNCEAMTGVKPKLTIECSGERQAEHTRTDFETTYRKEYNITQCIMFFELGPKDFGIKS